MSDRIVDMLQTIIDRLDTIIDNQESDWLGDLSPGGTDTSPEPAGGLDVAGLQVHATEDKTQYFIDGTYYRDRGVENEGNVGRLPSQPSTIRAGAVSFDVYIGQWHDGDWGCLAWIQEMPYGGAGWSGLLAYVNVRKDGRLVLQVNREAFTDPVRKPGTPAPIGMELYSPHSGPKLRSGQTYHINIRWDEQMVAVYVDPYENPVVSYRWHRRPAPVRSSLFLEHGTQDMGSLKGWEWSDLRMELSE